MRSLDSENAFLVIAHEDVQKLSYLNDLLNIQGKIYFHIDTHSDFDRGTFDNYANVKVFNNYSINWGSWEMIEATKLLANEAIRGGARRVTLISGVSHPLKSESEICKFLNSSVDLFDASEITMETTPKSFRKRFTSGHKTFGLRQNLFGRLVRRASREFHRRFKKVDPLEYLKPGQLMLGSQWWSVTAETYKKAMEYAAANPGFDEYFKQIECADESYFQSLFKQVSTNHVNSGTTYVKWGKRGTPQLLTIEDLVVARQDPNKYFVRKIYSKDVELIEYLDEVWRG